MDPSSNSVLPTGWVDILSGVDISVMMAIGVVAFALCRSSRIGEGWAIAVPMLLGLGYGLLEATEKGWGVPAHIAKGVLLNGAGATIAGRSVAMAMEKLWPATPPRPPDPPADNPLTRKTA